MKPCFFGEQPNSLGMEGIDPGQVVCQAELLSSRLKIPSPLFYIGGMVAFHPNVRRPDWSACLWSFGIGNRAG